VSTTGSVATFGISFIGRACSLVDIGQMAAVSS